MAAVAAVRSLGSSLGKNLREIRVHLCQTSAASKGARDKSAAEKRRQLIQESKFLGGDMEHTHLVKGLDFALLQKAQTTLTTNDIVISKLTQILSYLRQGTRHKKIKKKDKGKLDDKRAPEADLSIFEDIGDYIPSAGSSSKPPKDKDRHRERDRERERRETGRERGEG
ncbi:hypothetical protein FQN60_002477, partial [Etheostoma spectabile]